LPEAHAGEREAAEEDRAVAERVLCAAGAERQAAAGARERTGREEAETGELRKGRGRDGRDY